MKIVCNTIDQFYEAIDKLTVRGLGYNAFPDTLTIHLTGGF